MVITLVNIIKLTSGYMTIFKNTSVLNIKHIKIR